MARKEAQASLASQNLPKSSSNSDSLHGSAMVRDFNASQKRDYATSYRNKLVERYPSGNFMPSRSICTRPQYEETMASLDREIVQIVDPGKNPELATENNGLHNKLGVLDLKNGIISVFTKCKSYFDKATKTFIETDLASPVPISSSCGASAAKGMGMQHTVDISASNQYRIPDEPTILGLDLDSVKISVELLNLKRTHPEYYVLLVSELEKIHAAKIPRDWRIPLAEYELALIREVKRIEALEIFEQRKQVKLMAEKLQKLAENIEKNKK